MTEAKQNDWLHNKFRSHNAARHFPKRHVQKLGQVFARTTKRRLYAVLKSVTISKDFLIGSDEPPQIPDISVHRSFVL